MKHRLHSPSNMLMDIVFPTLYAILCGITYMHFRNYFIFKFKLWTLDCIIDSMIGCMFPLHAAPTFYRGEPMKIRMISATVALLLSASFAHAGVIPYGNVGTIAPTSMFTATATGNVIGEFVEGGAASGGGAADSDSIELVDVTQSTNSGWLFPNQTTTAGTNAHFLSVNAGDVLEFKLQNFTLGATLSSIPADSSDGDNHVYTTSFAGGILNGASIPAGTYIGFEDEPANFGSGQHSDWNYNDDTFVFQDVGTNINTTPEPGGLYLLGSGLLSMAGLLRRKLHV